MLKKIKQWVKKRPKLVEIYLYFVDLGRLLAVAGPRWRKALLFHKVRPYTMVPYEGVDNLYTLCSAVERQNLPGAFVECGVWNGGCAALMAHAAKQADSHRITWLFDSFEGLPEPTGVDGGEAQEMASSHISGHLSPIGHCVGTLEKVEKILFKEFRIPREDVRIVKGWFQDTLPIHEDRVGPISLLRLDGDWYESTKVCLEAFYDKVVPGGYVVIDDYGHWEGCRKAVDEYLARCGVRVDLKPAGHSVVYFQKPR